MLVTLPSGEGVVLLSESDYRSMAGTSYLLGTPENNAGLFESIQQAEAGELIGIDLDDW